jgi:hypothetical protein
MTFLRGRRRSGELRRQWHSLAAWGVKEVREADQLKMKSGVGSAHRKRMARQGWWLSGPIPMR